MDPFKGNKRLESAIYDGMDYALYSRHDLTNTFMPFMMLYKDGNQKLVRVAYEGDPNIGFEEILKNDNENYDQIVMCSEGRVPFDGTKYDAIIVKGFDTSEPEGLLFFQRFQGLESGKKFKKLGRLSLASISEKLPVNLVPRNSNKEIEEPYVSGMVINNDDGLTSRVIIAGHENVSILINYLYPYIMNSFSKNESEFSGIIEIKFVPGTLADNEFNKFVIDQVCFEILNDQIVQDWESKFNRKVKLSYQFERSEEILIETFNESENEETSNTSTILENKIQENENNKPWWKFW